MNNYFGRSLKAVNLCWKQIGAEGAGAGRRRGHGRVRGRGRGASENPPLPPPPMTIEQLMGMQANMMQAMMNRMNNELVAAPPPVQVRDKRGEFLKGRPPVFTHASDPLEAEAVEQSPVQRPGESVVCLGPAARTCSGVVGVLSIWTPEQCSTSYLEGVH